MLRSCCCEDNAEATQVSFQPKAERKDYSYASDAVMHPSQQEPPKQQVTSYQTPAPTANEERDKADEKAKIQDVVKAFARRAIKGIDAQIIKEDTSDIIDMKYSLEKNLRELTIKVDGQPHDSCNISDVGDIFQGEDGADRLPPSVVSALPYNSGKRLVVVRHGGRSLYLLEKSEDSAQSFFTAMRVLRLYCQQQEVGKGGSG